MKCVAMLFAMLVNILLLFNFGYSIFHITYGLFWSLYQSSYSTLLHIIQYCVEMLVIEISINDFFSTVVILNMLCHNNNKKTMLKNYIYYLIIWFMNIYITMLHLFNFDSSI